MLVNRGLDTEVSLARPAPKPTDEDRQIYEEMAELTRCVEMMTQTIREMEAPVSSTSEQLPLANSHLGELAKMTEDGTHKVMSLTEEIETNRRNLLEQIDRLAEGVPPEQTHLVNHIRDGLKADETRLTDIAVALSFQDLVAQRVAKLMTVLDEIQHKMLRVLVIFGIQKKEGAAAKDGRGDEMLKQLEASKHTALQQEVVDDILSKLGCK
ncbi:MAG: hypothetical protein D6690_06760 [Nitrospirae bacterium]|nr:MAG: hypothetical protein D6690_06760 [Nitrospirota bacterium]